MGFYSSNKQAKIDEKTFNIVKQIFKQKGFYKLIRTLRTEFAIPPQGLNIKIFDRLVIQDINPRVPFRGPSRSKYIERVRDILAQYGLSLDWFDLFNDYILFRYMGEIHPDTNQIILLDLGKENARLDEHKKILEKTTELNPIVIMIPPLASERDILDFIYKKAKNIKKIQKKYEKDKSALSKKRRKNLRVQKRNEFIYANSHIPKKDLMSKVHEKFGDILDYTYLSKIISKGTKKIKLKRLRK